MRREILKYLDYASYIALLIATVLIVVFEVSANMLFYKLGLYMYEVCFLLLIVFTFLRIYSVYKKNAAEEDATFSLSARQKVFLFIKLALILLGFCLTTVMLIKFN